MSSPRYASPLRLELRRSRWLALYLASVHAGALLLIPLLPLGAVLGTALAGLIAASFLGNYIARVQMRRDKSIVALVWGRDGDWLLIERGGRTPVCSLRPDSYVHPRLCLLNFAGERRGSVVLLPDSLDSESFRRLRVRLGLRNPAAAGPA